MFKCKVCGKEYKKRKDMVKCFEEHLKDGPITLSVDEPNTEKTIEVKDEAPDILSGGKCPPEIRYLSVGSVIALRVMGRIGKNHEVIIDSIDFDR